MLLNSTYFKSRRWLKSERIQQGKESGRGEILEIYIGKGEDKGRFSEQGNKGKIIFEYWQPVTDRFWNSQYLKEFTLEK